MYLLGVLPDFAQLLMKMYSSNLYCCTLSTSPQVKETLEADLKGQDNLLQEFQEKWASSLSGKVY